MMAHREYRDVQRFVDSSKTLLSTSKTLRDIYEVSTSLHMNEKACIYFDEDGKKQSYTYAEYKNHVYYLARHLSSVLSALPAGSLVALKLKNCPSWPLLFWATLMVGHPLLLVDANWRMKTLRICFVKAEPKRFWSTKKNPIRSPRSASMKSRIPKMTPPLRPTGQTR
jgi:acyl-coenzyme A synthetase/AMP-(fatty) acid ligase